MPTRQFGLVREAPGPDPCICGRYVVIGLNEAEGGCAGVQQTCRKALKPGKFRRGHGVMFSFDAQPLHAIARHPWLVSICPLIYVKCGN
jgi:hypothetical protein